MRGSCGSTRRARERCAAYRDVVTGNELAALIGPVPSVVKAPIAYYPIAIDRARYVGEPVAVVVAETRYIAEDACDLIEVEYDLLPAAADLESATAHECPGDPRQGRIERRQPTHLPLRRSRDCALPGGHRVFELSLFVSALRLDADGDVRRHRAFRARP